MENDCLVSIIIPVYNVKPYLIEALDSVLYQTYKNLEIIVIDDGSTDGSGALCDKYSEKDRRVLVLHQENKGLSSARNAGLDLMHGDAVVFLDPDDAYHPDYVNAMMTAMISEKADIVLCQYTVHKTTDRIRQTGREKTQPQAKQGMYDRESALRALADGMINVSVWNKLYRRELWRDIRFPDGHVYEDIDTTYKVFHICRTVYALKQPLYLHRKRPGSITDTCSWENINDRNLAFAHFETFIEANTPEIFTIEQLNKRRQGRLNGMISLYIQYSEKSADSGEMTGEKLKQEIIECGKEIGIKSCGVRTRAAYWMLCSCPFLLKLLYPIYRPVRLLVWAIIRR